MNCPLETREDAQLLLDYCARKLEAEPAAVLERHIAICGACREFASSQRAVWRALDAWEAAPVSADFDDRLYRRIETEVSWWDLLLRPFRPVTLRRSLPATAMAGLLVLAGVVLERPTISPAPVPDDVTQVDSVQPEQVEHALDAMEILNEFSRHVRTDKSNSKL
jgi:anti-sigma factor RsiW